ncbi:uncharacterized protein [Haliotis asinina]|uniref:uncharacterized protein isoform X2 n=1 Tax=Haliotis asinina TaxID=109174 RepID=UPI003531E991
MALRGQHDKAYSLSNFPAHQNQSMISEKTRSKTVPYVSKPFPQDIQVCSGESRRLTVTDDFQSSRHGKRSTSLLSTQAAPMVRGHSTNRLLCHVRTTSEEILPEAIIKFPTKSNPCNTPPKTSDETLRKGISALPTNSKSSHIQRSCDSFVQHSSYEKHEVTSEGDRITLQKCSQSIICITDKVKIFDSDGEMVREGDVLYIDKEGGYYGVYIGDGRVTFVEVDGRVTTKTVNENLSIPIATEQMDTSAGYHGLQPRSRLETSRRAKDLIGQHYPGSGEDFTWLCRYNVPCVPK